MKRYLFSLAGIALLLGGCALMNPAAPLPASTTADLQKGAYTAKLGFQAALTGAVVYIELPRCDRPTSPVVCSKQAVVDVMRKAIVAADSGTQAAEDAARSLNSDSTALAALVTAAEASVKALQTITPKK